MPSNEELEKQIEELRQLVSENREATNTRWSDSPWAIGLQILIAVAAVAIAWAQFNAAAIQTDLSTKQTRLQEFEIIKSLSNLRPNDSVAVDNLFGYIATLDKDLQQKFIDNNLKSSAINYFTYQSYLYLFENFEYDTVSVVGDIMTKIASHLKEKRFDHITNPQYATRDYRQITTWAKLVSNKANSLSFPAYQKLLTSYSAEFVTSIMVLQEVIDYQQPNTSTIKLRDDIDTAFMFKMIPYDFNLVSGLSGPMVPLLKDVGVSIRVLISSKFKSKALSLANLKTSTIEKLITNDYAEDIYKVFLLYLQEAKDLDDFKKHNDLCVNIIKTQKALRKNLEASTYTLKLKKGKTSENKKFVRSYRLWLKAEKLRELKKAAEAGEPYALQVSID